MRLRAITPFSRRAAAFTLAEVVVSVGIASLSIGGIIYGYVLSARNAEWSSYNLAAQSLALMRVEQTRACKWDPEGVPVVDELTTANFAMQTNVLDVPISGTNITWATNFTTVTTLSTNPPYKMIRVDCVWKFTTSKLFTNTVVTYRAPDT